MYFIILQHCSTKHAINYSCRFTVPSLLLFLMTNYSAVSTNSYITPNTKDETCNFPNLDIVNLPDANQTCIEHNGLTRCWYTFVPESAKSSLHPVPLVFDLHGYNLCAVYSSNYTGWDVLAEEKGFVVVWPQSNMDSYHSDAPCWDFGNCCCFLNGTPAEVEIDDIGFLHHVAANTVKQVNESIMIDTRRIYFAGHSNGCIMAQAMAAMSSDLVAAVCCHAGMLLTSPPSSLYVPTSVQVVMGNLDFMMNGSVEMGFPGAMQNLELWGDINNCTAQKSTKDDDNLYTTHERYNCSKGVEVRMVELYNVGHWPYVGMDPNTSYSSIGAPPGAVVPAVDTTLLSWEFCSRFSSESTPNIPEVVQVVDPNVFASGSSCCGISGVNLGIFLITLSVILS